jgi:DNA-binding CsgD family transcriptional regulator
MTEPIDRGSWALSDKEKQTLRMIVRGHDAKSIARSLGLSVHTINERLRDARRKMGVSSSREAARLLCEAEADSAHPTPPDFVGDAIIGGDRASTRPDQQVAPATKGRARNVLIGALLMALALSLMLLALQPATVSPNTAPAAKASETDIAGRARDWLGLLDESRWQESYADTGGSFRKLNTLEAWAAASDQARRPLGAMISRTFVGQQHLPAPPFGYEVVKFRTRYTNKPEAVETVVFEREDDMWRIVGVTID